jgi:hypothetical protein
VIGKIAAYGVEHVGIDRFFRGQSDVREPSVLRGRVDVARVSVSPVWIGLRESRNSFAVWNRSPGDFDNDFKTIFERRAGMFGLMTVGSVGEDFR